ncbi:MAG: Crp/Fnr family transcriptional regulator [Burkholderiaceae bacterium]|nr:Crp/Fnr family transcriptional regulator [Burkholderiaceae bacterium]
MQQALIARHRAPGWQPVPPSPLSLPPRPVLPQGLRAVEGQRVESGTWFAGLSARLRQAILARARVQHVRRGTCLVQRGAIATDWVGVAGGALALGTSWRDGRAFTLSLLGPGDWYGDIALIDNSPVDLDIVAQVHSTVLVVPRDALRELLQAETELRGALLQLDCRRLRHMFRRLEELQTLPLSQRVALKLQRLVRQFGRPAADGSAVQQIDLTLTQGDLAGLLCASRQRINGVLRQLQGLGILGCSHGRIEVLNPTRLADVASGKLVLEQPGG